MYDNVVMRFSSHADCIKSMSVYKEVPESRCKELFPIDFGKDDVHPLLQKAALIEPKDKAKMLDFYREASQDKDFIDSVSIYHNHHQYVNSGHYGIKGMAHKCDLFSLQLLLEKQVKREKQPWIKRTYQNTYEIAEDIAIRYASVACMLGFITYEFVFVLPKKAMLSLFGMKS